ncbi:hypothetical protein GpartN1_g4578.t1 [Galdieria partita]|uniref:Uncharacterized protein n=1 Tax=Galdieria partita TaxID=83374 RepID=A0A9C7URV2_9RHOD|nr:hypothetical protein GpartN1_g4578.t1 [Galdieria partita]
MGSSFLVFPSSCSSFLGTQLEKAICARGFLLNGDFPHFLPNLRPQAQHSTFSLNFLLPKLFLYSLRFPVISGPAVTKELGKKNFKVPLSEQGFGRDASVEGSSYESMLLTKKSTLIAEWLLDTEKILLKEEEDSALLENLGETSSYKGEEWCLESSRRQEGSFVPVKWANVFIISFGKGNKLFFGFLHVIATVVLFFVSNVHQLSKITYTTACRFGDGIHLVSLKLSSHRNSTNFES